MRVECVKCILYNNNKINKCNLTVFFEILILSFKMQCKRGIRGELLKLNWFIKADLGGQDDRCSVYT